MNQVVVEEYVEEGYKQVRVGPDSIVIPENWSVERLEPYITIDTGSAFPSEQFNNAGNGWPLIRIRNLPKGETSTYYTGEFDDKDLTDPGEILIGMDGEFHTVRWDGERGVLNQRVARVKSDDSEVDESFLYYRLIDEIKKVEERTPATTVKHLSKRDINGIQTPLPPVSEQRRIAAILSTVDGQIQQTDEIIEKTKELKRGLMQDFFRPVVSDGHSTKLGLFPSDWEFGQIQEFNTKFISGGTPSRDRPDYFDGDIPWLKTGEVQNSRVRNSDEFITEKGLKESSASLVPPGSILVAMYGGGTVGNVGLLEIQATTNQACCAIQTNDSVLVNEFLYYQLLFEHRRLVSYAAGSSQQNLSQKDVKQFDIVVPPVEHQQHVANVLSEIDEKLYQEQLYNRHLKELKRGLMQDLLTGKVRVNTEN